MPHRPLIIDTTRSPRGHGNVLGALHAVQPVDLLAQQLRALAAHTDIDTAQVADVLIGCARQSGEQGCNIGQRAVLAAGWSERAVGVTLNHGCASSLSALHLAAHQALAHDSLVVGGGVEMASRVALDADPASLAVAADAVAATDGFTPAQCEAYALASQQRASHARAQGYFRSIHPALGADGQVVLAQDETPLAELAALAELPLTLGHAHHHAAIPADGASAVLLASPVAAARLGLHARGRILAMADAPSDPIGTQSGAQTGAVAATQRVLARADLAVSDIDVFEVHESFAALLLHYMKHLHVPHDKLNVNGSTLALGHAAGATGSTLVGMALDELERRGARRAVVAVGTTTGRGVAMVIERAH